MNDENTMNLLCTNDESDDNWNIKDIVDIMNMMMTSLQGI